MKFRIFRTSDIFPDEPDPSPAPGAVSEPNTHGGTARSLWYVEVESLEALLALSEACKAPLIVGRDSSSISKLGWTPTNEPPEIEVYDDYRE